MSARKYRHIYRPYVTVTPEGRIEFDFSDSYETAQDTTTLDLIDTPDSQADSESASSLLDHYLEVSVGGTTFDVKPTQP